MTIAMAWDQDQPRDRRGGTRPAQPVRRYKSMQKNYRPYSNKYKEQYRPSGSSYEQLDRENIIQNEYSEYENGYWGAQTIDYGAGENMPEDHYGYDTGYNIESRPGHVHQPGQEMEHRYSHDRWARSRYGVGFGGGAPEHWTDRDGDYEPSVDAQYPEQGPMGDSEMPSNYRDEYYVDAPDYYRDRYMPTEDSLTRIYYKMFRDIEYNIKVPVMQLIATIALFIIFIGNYYLNYEYVAALSLFTDLIKYQPPPAAALFGALFGLFLYVFPHLDRELKRSLVIGTIIILIVLFAGPALLVAPSYDMGLVGIAFRDSIIIFLQIAAVFVYWAPMFLGIYGIWSRNSFYIGASAMFLFLIIIMLDIYLFSLGETVTKTRSDWLWYALFAIILFCYMEMSDSAITFAKYTSITDVDAIDPGYYEHLDNILKKYFIYFILITIFITIIAWITLNLTSFLKWAGSVQVSESLELTSIYGIIISLIVVGLVILFVALFARNEKVFRNFYYKLEDKFTSKRFYQSYQPVQSAERAVHAEPAEPKKRYDQGDKYSYKRGGVRAKREY